MKNIRRFHDQELKDYIGSLWQSVEFKKAHNDPKSPIYKCIEKVIQQGPMWFYDMSDPIERTQFSSWWRHIQHRHYDIPAVTDLYYYHELTHIANHVSTAFFNFPLSKVEWQSHVFQEELIASLESEVFVYWYFPTLRAKTFKFEIWADRLKVPVKKNLDNAKYEAKRERQRIFEMPMVNDEIEMGIHKYNKQNSIWCNYWADISTTINKEVSYIRAGNEYYKNLEKFIADNTTDGVVFLKETKLFHEYTKGTIITSFKG